MNEDKKLSDMLKRYLNWPAAMAVLMVLIALSGILGGRYAPMLVLIFSVSGIAIAALLLLVSRSSILTQLTAFAMNTEEVQNTQVQDLDVPYAMMDRSGSIIWRNRAFNSMITGDKAAKKDIFSIFPELEPQELQILDKEGSYSGWFRDHCYDVRFKQMQIDGEDILAVYFYDETALAELTLRYNNEKSVSGLIFMDNYDEAMEGIEEVNRALAVALIDNKVDRYISRLGGTVVKTEKDKYSFNVDREHLDQLESERFDILEDVKTVKFGDSKNITLSIGVGIGAQTIAENYKMARSAIDVALGRGGDQVVVKDGEAVRYYGGKSQSIEKTTRVKARVKAQAFEDLILDKDRILIMGHKLPDADCLGSSIAIWRIAKTLGKDVHIVLGQIPTSLEAAVARFEQEDYPEDLFIDAEEAADLITADTALVVVDVNRPSITEAPELIDHVGCVVVFDHHRQSSEVIEKASLAYVEPYASSACEMISEILQYISNGVKLKNAEADIILAGIVVDTINFTNQCGVRTFEAAAFLRKNGADASRVRKLFRDSEADCRAKAAAVDRAEIFMKEYAITTCDTDQADSPTVVGAQAANDLLNIAGVKASFVLTQYSGKIYISARSMDEVNVQIIMERFGGGGHRNVAGAQLDAGGTSMEDAIESLKTVLREMEDSGEI
jgi:cyclic-di-AMP phosphodiesterase